MSRQKYPQSKASFATFSARVVTLTTKLFGAAFITQQS